MTPKPSRKRPAAVLLGVIALWMGQAATMRAMADNSGRAPAALSSQPVDWSIPDIDKLPNDGWGRAVRHGRELITKTYALIGPEVAEVAHRYSGNNLACESCHLEAATRQFGLPFQGVYANFPNYSARSGAVGTIENRINGCMRRSMSGRPLPLDSPEMTAIVAYLEFLSTGRPSARLLSAAGRARWRN
jgi:thiosulfate dehydrogenase